MINSYRIALMMGCTLLLLTGCQEELSEQGVLGVEVISIPSCDKVGNESAMKIEEATKIAKQDDHTVLKAWHYQDRTKLICVLKGDAVIVQE